MSVLQAVVLGAVQGLTEFIPISSSGHLVVVPELLGWDSPGLAFDVWLHSASLVALLVYFARDLLGLIEGAIRGGAAPRRLLLLLLVGSVPAGVAGIWLGGFFAETFEDAAQAALSLFITAAVLVAAELLLARHRRRSATLARGLRSVADLGWRDALLVGTAQAAAILPGLSRSGATIGTGLALAVEREEAARFAFLLAIPAIAGATLLQLPNLEGSGLGWGAAAAGFATSGGASYAAVAGLLRYLRTRSLYPFAVYCAVAGTVFYLLVR